MGRTAGTVALQFSGGYCCLAQVTTAWPEGWLNFPPGSAVFHLEDDPNWNERGLTLAEYQGDGRYTLQQWPFVGAPLRLEYRVVDVNVPDAAGNWSVDELISYPDGSGGAVQWPQVWSLKDGKLSVTRGAPPPELPLSQPWFQEYRLERPLRLRDE